jgi:hypothetical protein
MPYGEIRLIPLSQRHRKRGELMTEVNAVCCLAPDRTPGENPDDLQRCPSCGRKGKNVGMETVKAMLAVTLHRIQPDRTYLFCRTEACPVVYFADDGKQTFSQIFTESEMRELVHQKHPDDDDVFVCYCFRHTPGSIRAELMETGQSTVVETVTAGTKVHECACEIRNPQGSCCLGNVSAVVKRIRQEITARMEVAPQAVKVQRNDSIPLVAVDAVEKAVADRKSK